MPNSEDRDVAIVGAGPYGLSLAAHLRATGVDFRIFGRPMETWRTRMPAGLLLKSEGCASNLSDPAGRFTLQRFCGDNDLPYRDYAIPVPLDTFARYGIDFQRRLVPMVEETTVTSVDGHADGFELRLGTGEMARAGRVVVAVGLTYFGQLPSTLQGIPRRHVSHSSEYADLSIFRGRDVTVIGGGQSALETAALLSEQGTDVRVIVRAPILVWNPVPSPDSRPLRDRARRPMGGLGAGWRTLFYAEAPVAFRHLPEQNRLRVVRNALGPAGAWWLRERVEGQVTILLEHVVSEADMAGDRVRLRVAGRGHTTEILTDHVIAATGYRIDLGAMPFLEASVLSRVRQVDRAPELTANFESSVPGLYFVGQAAAPMFGPVMRFVYGADFTARRLARHLGSASDGDHRWKVPRRTCHG
jgi:cation diffusion facilitator CzcD-associated flavoprotein CzcO